MNLPKEFNNMMIFHFQQAQLLVNHNITFYNLYYYYFFIKIIKINIILTFFLKFEKHKKK